MWDGDVAVSNTSNRWGKWRESHGKRTDDKRHATLSDGGTAMSLYQIQATDEVVNGGQVTHEPEERWDGNVAVSNTSN